MGRMEDDIEKWADGRYGESLDVLHRRAEYAQYQRDHPNEAASECDDPTCPGYAVFNIDDTDAGYIQRCDTCEKFPDDATAAAQAELDGFILNYVDGEGWLVLETPDVREAPGA